MQHDNIFHGYIVFSLITFEYILPVCDASKLALCSSAEEFFRQGEVHVCSPEIASLFVSPDRITAIVCENLICQSSFLPSLNYVYIYRLEPPACSVLACNHFSYVPLNGSGLFLYTRFASCSTFKYIRTQLSFWVLKHFFSTSLKSCEQAF